MLAALERDGRRARQLARELPRSDLHLERGVLAQDRVLQAAELRAGLDADLLHQHAARLLIRLERLGLPPAAVQREHALRVQALAQGVLGDDRVDLARDLQVTAGGEVGPSASSRASTRSSSSRRISGAANGSSATSASAGPRHSASASRAAPSSPARLASARSSWKRRRSIASGSTRSS